ncbi:MAG: BspA family leucine-rich repeat surface protein [Pleomorphochaeta sp.]
MKTNKNLIIYIILIILFSLIITSCGDYMQTMEGAVATFETNGGSLLSDQSFIGYVIEPETPTKDSYSFIGWYCDEECTNAWDFDDEVLKSDIILYAKWELDCVDSFSVSSKSSIDFGDVANIDIYDKDENQIAKAKTESDCTVFKTTINLDDDYYYLYQDGIIKGKLIINNERAKFVNKDTITPMTRSELTTLLNTDMDYDTIETFGLDDMSSLGDYFDGSANKDITNWDVSNVNNMESMFNNASSFNQNISSWDVSNVTNMRRMFSSAEAFNQDISNWDVSNVTNMGSMFSSARAFDQDLTNWNVSSVTSMSSMFMYAFAFDGDISSWNVGNCTIFRNMFSGATLFNSNISNWDVSKATTFELMFESATSFNQDLSNWNVSNVTNMVEMFSGATSFNGGLLNWNVSKVESMLGMFKDANLFNKDISNWNVINVKDMRYMFNNASSFNQNISGWDVDNVSSFDNIFDGSAIEDANKPEKFK